MDKEKKITTITILALILIMAAYLYISPEQQSPPPDVEQSIRQYMDECRVEEDKDVCDAIERFADTINYCLMYADKSACDIVLEQINSTR